MDKYCENCGYLMNSVHHSKKYCDECRPIITKKLKRENYHKNKKINKRVIDEAFKRLLNDDNFKPYHLTTKGFKEATNVSAITISKVLNENWWKILKYYNVDSVLFDYVCKEYNQTYITTLNSDVSTFVRNHKYITGALVRLITSGKIKLACGFSNPNDTHSAYMLQQNFNNIKDKFGYIPLCKEFQEKSPINLKVYWRHFNMYSYDKLIEMFANNEEEINRYYKYVADSSGYSEKEKENEFKRVFNNFHLKHGVYPTMRQFKKLSSISINVFMTNQSFNQARQKYGYPTNYSNNVSETACLNLLSDVIKSNYEPQKTWKWLINDKNSHLYCDGFFKDYNLVVEYDGFFHREPADFIGGEEKLKTQQENDRLKDRLVKEHGYKMLRIDSRDNWYDKNYLIKRLKEVGINFN